jgi:uncharacterized protein (TIGR03067 family)
MAALAIATGPENDEAAKNELARFEGVWRFALVEVDGVKQPEVPFETHKMVILKDGRFVIMQGNRITRGNIKMNPSKSPKQYDVQVGGAAAMTAHGVYELDGDTCKLCFPLKGGERPTDLESKPGGGRLFHIFKRDKADLKETLIAIDRQDMAGRWQMQSEIVNGVEVPAEQARRKSVEFDTKGKAKILDDGKLLGTGTINIDPTQQPMRIEIAEKGSDGSETTILGIYKIESDSLTICRTSDGKSLPEDFSSKTGSGNTLRAFKRQKKELK